MKYVFLFLYFMSPTSIYDFKVTVTTEEDCKNLAKAIHDIVRPHLLAKGFEKDKVEQLLETHTKYVPINGNAGTTD